MTLTTAIILLLLVADMVIVPVLVIEIIELRKDNEVLRKLADSPPKAPVPLDWRLDRAHRNHRHERRS